MFFGVSSIFLVQLLFFKRLFIKLKPAMKKFLIFSTYLIFILALHENAYSFQPKGAHWKPIPELSDEFNGDELDHSKWFDHNPWWRLPVIFFQSYTPPLEINLTIS